MKRVSILAAVALFEGGALQWAEAAFGAQLQDGQVDAMVDGSYVTAEDATLYKSVRDEYVDRCDGVTFDEIDRVGRLERLVDVNGGSEPYVLTLMRESQDSADFKDKFSEWVTSETGAEGGKAAGLVALASLICCCWCCCWVWTACPFCRKIRIGERDRDVQAKAKLGAGLGMCGIFGIAFIGVCIAWNGASQMAGGMDTMSCAGAEMVHNSYAGASPNFVGMLPAFSAISELNANLEDSSAMFNAVDQAMADTIAIEEAYVLLTSQLDLMDSLITWNYTVHPFWGEDDFMHECQLCEELAQPLEDLSISIKESVGGALAEARNIVRDKLTGEGRALLKEQLMNSTAPLIAFKDQLNMVMSDAVDPNGELSSAHSEVNSAYKPLIDLAGVACLVYIALALTSIGLWLKKERTPEGTYNKLPHRVSGCAMCCGTPCLVVPVLFMAAAAGGAFYVTSSFCLTLTVANSDMIRDIAPAIDFDLSSDNAQNVLNLIDVCVVPIGSNIEPNVNTTFLDAVYVRDENNELDTARAVLFDALFAPLRAVFRNIDLALARSNVYDQLAWDVQDINLMLEAVTIRTLMMPIQADVYDAFPNMRGTSLMDSAASTSCDCENVFVSSPIFDRYSYTGLDQFNLLHDNYGVRVPDTRLNRQTECTPQVICDPALTSSYDACEEANKFLKLKRRVLESPIYRCDVFVLEDGETECDPTAMVQNADSSWTGDCILTRADGSKYMQTKIKWCNLVDLSAYVSSFPMRLDQAHLRFARTALYGRSPIQETMRNVIETYVERPMRDVTNGMTCTAFRQSYQKVIDGFCYQTAIGLGNVYNGLALMGFCMLLIFLVLYCVWRVQIDNVNKEMDGSAGAAAPVVQSPAPAEEAPAPAEEPAAPADEAPEQAGVEDSV